MKYLLDSNAVIALLDDGRSPITARVADCEEGELGVSSISLAEVAVGSLNGKPPPMEVLNGFLEEIVLLPFDEAAARTYAKLPFKRGSFDRLIAAHAMSLDLIVVTGNGRDFSGVLGLKVENWTLA